MSRVLLFAAVIGIIWWMWKGGGARPAKMPPSEAAKLLGVSDSAGADEVIAAHKKLIAKVHPDAGGSAELAAQVNQARDVLLARISKSQG